MLHCAPALFLLQSFYYTTIPAPSWPASLNASESEIKLTLHHPHPITILLIVPHWPNCLMLSLCCLTPPLSLPLSLQHHPHLPFPLIMLHHYHLAFYLTLPHPPQCTLYQCKLKKCFFWVFKVLRCILFFSSGTLKN